MNDDARHAGTTLAGQRAAGGTPNVILVTFDSLSAEDMSLYGYRRHTTPFIDSFGGESYVFENMHANYNSTIPSLASIMTSRYPVKHRFDWLCSQPTGGSRAEDPGDVLKSKD